MRILLEINENLRIVLLVIRAFKADHILVNASSATVTDMLLNVMLNMELVSIVNTTPKAITANGKQFN